MNIIDKIDDARIKHLELVESYIYQEVMYSLSFEDQVSMDLRYANIQISDYDEGVDALSDEEIKKRMESLKRPWWYGFYEKRIQKHKVLLFFILTLLSIKNLILWLPKQLYKMAMLNIHISK